MGAVIWFANAPLAPYTTGPGLVRWAAMFALVGTGALVYFAATFVFGAFAVADVKALLRRKKAT